MGGYRVDEGENVGGKKLKCKNDANFLQIFCKFLASIKIKNNVKTLLVEDNIREMVSNSDKMVF
jgi:hypothetical protein